MIVLACGGRDCTDRKFVFRTLDELHRASPITTVIEGGQRKTYRGETVGGVDYWANRWAEARGIPVITFKANWDDISRPGAVIKTNARGKKYDAAAGPRRNAEMLSLRPAKVVGVCGGPGTADMLHQARAAGIDTIEVRA